MDIMDKYKIQESIKDVITILDSAPTHWDMVPETNAVQLTNRAPIAHLAIERGLKALIVKAGGTTGNIHGLKELYVILTEFDSGSAEYLATAFDDAVTFFGYNVHVKGFKQFRSLGDYLSKVGTKKAFNALRYWAIGESVKGQNPIQYISPPIHRELLCALWCLFLPTRRDKVSDRVEREVAHAMVKGRQLSYSDNYPGEKRDSVRWYMDWLREHPTRCGALREAVAHNFAIKEDDELVGQTLADAYNDLALSKDPAVQYYIKTLTYLPKGSQKGNPDAIPEVKWSNKDQTDGSIVTPADTNLGFVERYADGSWGIIPTEEGLVRVTGVALSLADAKNYLVNRLTRQVTVTIGEQSKQLRILSDRDFFSQAVQSVVWDDSAGLSDWTSTYELEFWDGEHGLHSGAEILVELQAKGSHSSMDVLEGTVAKVALRKVSVTGIKTFKPIKAVEC